MYLSDCKFLSGMSISLKISINAQNFDGFAFLAASRLSYKFPANRINAQNFTISSGHRLSVIVDKQQLVG